MIDPNLAVARLRERHAEIERLVSELSLEPTPVHVLRQRIAELERNASSYAEGKAPAFIALPGSSRGLKRQARMAESFVSGPKCKFRADVDATRKLLILWAYREATDVLERLGGNLDCSSVCVDHAGFAAVVEWLCGALDEAHTPMSLIGGRTLIIKQGRLSEEQELAKQE